MKQTSKDQKQPLSKQAEASAERQVQAGEEAVNQSRQQSGGESAVRQFTDWASI